MIISHKHKFVYAAIPKTASLSIKTALPPPEYKPYGNHVKLSAISHLFKSNRWDLDAGKGSMDQYFTFLSYRNPWAMVVSCYEYVMARPHHPAYELYSPLTFEEHVKENIFYRGYIFNRTNRTGYGVDEQDRPLYDFILKTETFSRDWKYICKKIGIDYKPPKKRNVTKHPHYSEYYSEETKNIVAKAYRKEVEYFRYKFI